MPNLSNAHALVVGIANYTNVSRLPPTVVKDASDIYNALVDPQVCAYPPENVRLLVDEQAMQANLRAALDALAVHVNADPTVLIYPSSHGGRVRH